MKTKYFTKLISKYEDNITNHNCIHIYLYKRLNEYYSSDPSD